MHWHPRAGWRAVRAPFAVLCLLLTTHATGVTGQSIGREPAILAAPVSVRSAGLNGAGAAIVGDAGTVFSNPAGLATLRHIGIEGGFRTLPARGYLVTGAMGWRLRQFDLGGAVGRLDFGDNSTLIPNVPLGARADETVAVGSLVYRYGMIAVGGTGKWIRRAIDTDVQRAVSADVGLAIAVFDIRAIGFSVQNIGGNWRDDSTLDLRRVSRFGFTMNYVDPQETLRLMSTLEVQWPDGRASRFVLGGEAGVVVEGVGVIARTAYGSQPTASAISQWAVGLSLVIARLALDYAYAGTDQLESGAHRFGLRLGL